MIMPKEENFVSKTGKKEKIMILFLFLMKQNYKLTFISKTRILLGIIFPGPPSGHNLLPILNSFPGIKSRFL